MYLKLLSIFSIISFVCGDRSYYYDGDSSYESSEELSGEFVSIPLNHKTIEEVLKNNEIVFVKFFTET